MFVGTQDDEHGLGILIMKSEFYNKNIQVDDVVGVGATKLQT